MPSGPAAVPDFESFRAFRRSSRSISEFSGEESGFCSFWVSGIVSSAFSIASLRSGSVARRRSSDCRFS